MEWVDGPGTQVSSTPRDAVASLSRGPGTLRPVKHAWVELLRCPACGQGFHVDATRQAGPEWIEGFVVCRGCLGTWPVIGGSLILPADLRAHLREQGSVYRRLRLADPRVTRLVLAGLGAGHDLVPFAELTEHYGDLVEDPSACRARAPDDESLDGLLLAAAASRPLGRALDLGCGVGRSTFLLAAHGAQALGVDRSAARVRRARNLAVTEEAFYLPAPDDPRREVALDLGAAARAAVDFAVATPWRLPFADGAFDLVVDHGGDGRGLWPDPAAVRAELRRVLRPDGRCLSLGPSRDLTTGGGPGGGFVLTGRP